MASNYVAAGELQAALPTSSSADVPLVEMAVKGASRGIDRWCGQRFWVDTAVVARYYTPQTCDSVKVDPISTTSGLIVQTDTGGDGTYATTLTINTDFLLQPVNAAADSQPYTSIWLPTTTFPTSFGRATVKVTAKFGWATVPDDIHAAALLLARDLFKEMKDSPFGVAGTAEFGVMRIRQNATAQRLLAPYRRAMVA